MLLFSHLFFWLFVIGKANDRVGVGALLRLERSNLFKSSFSLILMDQDRPLSYHEDLKATHILLEQVSSPGIKVVDPFCFNLRLEPDFFSRDISLEDKLHHSKQWEEHGVRLRDFFSAHPLSYVPGGTYSSLAHTTKRTTDFVNVTVGAPRTIHLPGGAESRSKGYGKNGNVGRLINSARSTNRVWEHLRKVVLRRSISSYEQDGVESALTSEEQSQYRTRQEQLGLYLAGLLDAQGVGGGVPRHRMYDLVLGSIALADTHPSDTSKVTLTTRTFLLEKLMNSLYSHPVIGSTLPPLRVIMSIEGNLLTRSYGSSLPSPPSPSREPVLPKGLLAYGYALEK